MQIPKRRAQQLRTYDEQDEVIPLTPFAYERMKDDLRDLQTVARPQAVEDVSVAVQKGDLSENAEYQEAKMRLARIDGRIFSLTERLKRVALIDHTPDRLGRVQLGSTVTIRIGERDKTVHVVGPQESNPSRGRISHVSPLGAALLGHGVGERVSYQSPGGDIECTITDVR